MPDIAIVTDTTACVPPERVKQFGIEVVPVQLIFEDKTYRDGIDITPEEFYQRLRQAKKMPSSSTTSPEPYLEAFRRAAGRAGSVLCLTEPSRFSAMFDSARVAADIARTELPRLKIEVLECTTAAAGQGLVAHGGRGGRRHGQDAGGDNRDRPPRYVKSAHLRRAGHARITSSGAGACPRPPPSSTPSSASNLSLPSTAARPIPSPCPGR